MIGGTDSAGREREPIQVPPGTQKEVKIGRLVDTYSNKDMAEKILKTQEPGSYAIYEVYDGKTKGMIAYKTPEGQIQYRQFSVEDYHTNVINRKMLYRVNNVDLKKEDIKSYVFPELKDWAEMKLILKNAPPGTFLISPMNQADPWLRPVSDVSGWGWSNYYIRYKNSDGELNELAIQPKRNDIRDVFTSNEVKIEGHPAIGSLLEVLGTYPDEFKYILKPDPTHQQTVLGSNMLIPAVESAVPIPVLAKQSAPISTGPSEVKYPISEVTKEQIVKSLSLYPEGSFVVSPSSTKQEGFYLLSFRVGKGVDHVKIYKDDEGQLYLDQPPGTPIIKFKSVDHVIDHLKTTANPPIKFYLSFPEKYPMQNISKEEAEKILTNILSPEEARKILGYMYYPLPEGTFIIRPSQNPQLAYCSVSLRVSGGVNHFRIGTDAEGNYILPKTPPAEPLKAKTIDGLMDLLINQNTEFKSFLKLP